MATITENGIVIERLDNVVERLNTGFRQIYGQNINLAPDSPDGQMIGILAQMKMDIEELVEIIYQQLDPDLATGVWLEQRVAYAGLIRRQASYSYLPSVILTGEPNSPLHAGLIFSDPNKIRWILPQDVRLNDRGSIRVDLRSEELGAFNLAGNIDLTIETITLGLTSATTSTPAQTGSEEESDAQLRQRFFLSRSKNAQNSVDAIEAKIGELPDVKQVSVLENNTGQQDIHGVAAHSINVIVDGGEKEAIAEVIYQNKGAGVGLQGNTEVSLNIGNHRRSIRFDRVVPVDIIVSMRLVRYEDFTEINKAEIIQRLTDITFPIGQPVSLSRLYSPINQANGFWVKELKIARKGQTARAENIAVSPRELARILQADINIEVE